MNATGDNTSDPSAELADKARTAAEFAAMARVFADTLATADFHDATPEIRLDLEHAAREILAAVNDIAVTLQSSASKR